MKIVAVHYYYYYYHYHLFASSSAYKINKLISDADNN